MRAEVSRSEDPKIAIDLDRSGSSALTLTHPEEVGGLLVVHHGLL